MHLHAYVVHWETLNRVIVDTYIVMNQAKLLEKNRIMGNLPQK